MKFLDLSLSIESSIDQVISTFFTSDFFKSYVMQNLIFDKIDLRDKTQIFKSILEDKNLHSLMMPDSLTFRFDELREELIVDGFTITVGKLIETIDRVREIRNISAHSKLLSFSEKNIFKRNRYKLFSDKEYNKEELLIKGHFVLWLIQCLIKNNLIYPGGLLDYYKKYEPLLKSIAVIKPI